jgi:hypothetical protein
LNTGYAINLHSPQRPRGLVCILLLLTCCGQVRAVSSEKPPGTNAFPGAELFIEGAVRHLQLEINPQALDHLSKEAREFVRAQVRDGQVLHQDVAVHLKGSVGSFRPLNDKPAFTLDFAQFHPDRRFHGLRRIHLNNSVEDPSYCNEILGGEVFRAAGVPCPRVSRAIVTLNGRKLGLYTLKEGFTEDFLSCYFQKVGGNLFEPDEGHDVNEHLKKTSVRAGASGRATLNALSQAALDPNLSQRWNRLESVLDTERFLKFMGLEVMLCHRDGYCLARNNFRLYENAETRKMLFLPQGMDQLFGIPELPWMPHMAGLVARAVLETPQGAQRYREISKDLFQSVLQLQDLTNRVHQLVQPLRTVVAESEYKHIESAAADLIDRIGKRHQFLAAQMSNGPARALEFRQGIACLDGWTKMDEPASGQMGIALSPDGITSLEILTRQEATPSWRTKAALGPGRYHFQGKVRVEAVKELPFGTHQGAGLRIAGNVRQSEDLVGTESWRVVIAPFEVRGSAQEIEFICELRARSGQAWFDRGSLRVVQEP